MFFDLLKCLKILIRDIIQSFDAIALRIIIFWEKNEFVEYSFVIII